MAWRWVSEKERARAKSFGWIKNCTSKPWPHTQAIIRCCWCFIFMMMMCVIKCQLICVIKHKAAAAALSQCAMCAVRRTESLIERNFIITKCDNRIMIAFHHQFTVPSSLPSLSIHCLDFFFRSRIIDSLGEFHIWKLFIFLFSPFHKPPTPKQVFSSLNRCREINLFRCRLWTAKLVCSTRMLMAMRIS